MLKALLTLVALLALPVLADAQTHTFSMSWTLGAVAPDKSNAPTGVKVERKVGTAGTFAQVAQLGVVTTYSDTLANPAPGAVQYCYRVRAFNAVGDSPYSGEGCGTTAIIIVPTVPNAPGGFTVSAISASTIELSWGSVETAESYRWERRKGNQPKIVEQTGVVLASATSYRDSLLRKATTYCYDAMAVNVAGTSAPTPVLCATTRR